VHLTDFKVRILDGGEATGAVTRVLLSASDGLGDWTTIGVSPNIIEAAWRALEESIVYGLLRSPVETVEVGYVDQRHKEIDPEKSVWEVVSGGNDQLEIGGSLVNSRAYVSKFNFAGSDQQKKCGILSGGERNRLHLAMTLKTEANVLLLDEPTNDIDVGTLRALEEGIMSFAGCAVVISHDRWFLDRICTHILAFEGDSQVVWLEGTYSQYEANRKERLGDSGPKRIKYRKLVR